MPTSGSITYTNTNSVVLTVTDFILMNSTNTSSSNRAPAGQWITYTLPLQLTNNYDNTINLNFTSTNASGVVYEIYADLNGNGTYEPAVESNTGPITAFGPISSRTNSITTNLLLRVFVPASIPADSLFTNTFEFYAAGFANPALVMTNLTSVTQSGSFTNDAFVVEISDGIRSITSYDPGNPPRFEDRDITISITLQSRISIVTDSVFIYFDAGSIPDGPGGINTDERIVTLTSSDGIRWTGTIPADDFELIAGTTMQFAVVIEDNYVRQTYYYNDTTHEPWKFIIQDIAYPDGQPLIYPKIISTVQTADASCPNCMTLRFEPKKAMHISITVYDVLGEKVKTILDENRQPGTYTETWCGYNDSDNKVASGLYFIQYRTDSGINNTHKVLVTQ